MAEIFPGVTRGDSVYGYWLEGTKDALLQSGMAKSEWFLDGREKNPHGKTIRTVYAEQDGIAVECNQPARGLCSIRFFTGKDERDPATVEQLRERSLSTLFGHKEMDAHMMRILRGFWGNDRETQKRQIREVMEVLDPADPAPETAILQRDASPTLH